jgi:hypothetical protein
MELFRVLNTLHWVLLQDDKTNFVRRVLKTNSVHFNKYYYHLQLLLLLLTTYYKNTSEPNDGIY